MILETMATRMELANSMWEEFQKRGLSTSINTCTIEGDGFAVYKTTMLCRI